MIENKHNKIAAAISGMMTYIMQEEEAAAQAGGHIPQLKPKIETPFKLWGVSGRQDIMNMRSMMQLKAFNKTK